MKYIATFFKIEGYFGVILGVLGTIAGYYFLFTNEQLFILVLSQKNYVSALYSIIIVFLAAALYGKTVSIISHQTIEKALGIKNFKQRQR